MNIKPTALIIGATSGIGAEYARRLAIDGFNLIINVSSSGAFLPSPKTATYSGTKAFLRAFTESLHYELKDTGVQVQVVCPGLTRTDMHSRIGITDEYTPDWGPFQWISPQEVVECSLGCLKKEKVLCIPGRMTRKRPSRTIGAA